MPLIFEFVKFMLFIAFFTSVVIIFVGATVFTSGLVFKWVSRKFTVLAYALTGLTGILMLSLTFVVIMAVAMYAPDFDIPAP